MPEENRVFDVTKPKHVSPTPTSRPVIVGHQPMVSDPMVKDKDDEHLLNHTPTKINVTDQAAEHEPDNGHELKTGHEDYHRSESMTTASPAIIEPTHTTETKPAAEPETGPAKFDPPLFTPEADAAEETEPEEEAADPAAAQPAAALAPAEDPEPTMPDSVMDVPDAPAGDIPEIEPHETTAPADNDAPPQPIHPAHHIEGLHFAEPNRSGRGLKYLIIGLAVLLIAVYLLIDSGLISAGINLPFHVFKQDKAATTAQSNTGTQAPAASQTPASSLPDGFKLYSLADTTLTFAAPATWGEPSSVTEQGYAKRGGANQPSGTYAYLVSFATNKDVQVAVTSSQYLPPARDRLYYDYLQWCTGTNDGKYYLSVLNFTTTDKVDAPSTISCDQGPVAGAVKLDDTTLLQAKASDPAGHTIGDIYVKNLTDKNLPVFRVKDAAMTNGDAIKNLLGTVKFGAAS